MVDYKMQLTGWETSYSGSGAFEFPVNPQVLNFPLVMDRTITEIPYGLHHIVITGGGVKSRELVLTGTFHGANRLSDYNKLSEFVTSKEVCRFWLNSTDFFYVVGSGVRQSISGDKVNFVDYVVTLLAVSPFVYSTSRSASITFSSSAGSETATSALTNTGVANSVAKITITNNTSGTFLKEIEIGDSSTFANSLHKVSWFDSVGLGGGKSVVIYPFKFYESSDKSAIRSIRLGHPEKDGSLFGRCRLSTGSVPMVKPKTSTQKFCAKVISASATLSVTVKFDWFDANVG